MTPWREELMTGEGPPDWATSAFLFVIESSLREVARASGKNLQEPFQIV